MKEKLLLVWSKVQDIYKFIAKLTQPLRELPYGEDGKYIHMIMGLMLGTYLLLDAKYAGTKDLNAAGMILGGFVFGYIFEKIQKFFFGGKNTEKEQIKDSLRVMYGITPIALLAVYLDLARWFY